MTITTTTELPQTIRSIKCNISAASGTKVSVSVSTYDGPDDIFAMTPEQFCSDILEPSGQGGAATLVAPVFGCTFATLNTSCDKFNRNKVLNLAFPTAFEEIKKISWPG